jgi:hypothetical protein
VPTVRAAVVDTARARALELAQRLDLWTWCRLTGKCRALRGLQARKRGFFRLVAAFDKCALLGPILAQARNPIWKHHPASRHRRAPPPRTRRLHTNDTYLTSLRCSPGGSDCSSFAAFSPSWTRSVYKYREQRILNFVMPRVVLMVTAFAPSGGSRGCR